MSYWGPEETVPISWDQQLYIHAYRSGQKLWTVTQIAREDATLAQLYILFRLLKVDACVREHMRVLAPFLPLPFRRQVRNPLTNLAARR